VHISGSILRAFQNGPEIILFGLCDVFLNQVV
jgi:hypothetical protein